MRGRKPVPTTLKLVTGNPGRRPLPKNEPAPIGALSDEPPGHLNAEQRKLWRQTVRSSPLGLLKKLDAKLLEMFVVAADLHRQATERLNTDGPLLETPQGLRQHPATRIIAQQSVILAKCMSEMGFSPASRPRIEIVPDEDTQEENPLDKYFT